MSHELSSLRIKVAEMHRGLQESDVQREAAEEAKRHMHKTIQRLEGQVHGSEMRLATQDAAARQEISQLKASLHSVQNTLRDAKESSAAGADLQRHFLDLQSERDHLCETVNVQALLLEVLCLNQSVLQLHARYHSNDCGITAVTVALELWLLCGCRRLVTLFLHVSIARLAQASCLLLVALVFEHCIENTFHIIQLNRKEKQRMAAKDAALLAMARNVASNASN